MTRKQRHLLTRIIVAAVLFLAGSLLHLPELAEMAVFLVCYVVVGWDIVWKAITNILHGQVFEIKVTIIFRKLMLYLKKQEQLTIV